MSERRFPPPWTVETIPGGLKVCDANGQSLAYVYSRENDSHAHMAKVLTELERTTTMARSKAIPMIAYIGIAALLQAATSPTAAQEVQVQSVVAIDGKVNCSQMKTGATRPCEEFTPPPKVAVGETFSADGKTRQIGIIRAAQVKGHWIRVAAETLACG
jgi:hypothetical protein